MAAGVCVPVRVAVVVPLPVDVGAGVPVKGGRKQGVEGGRGGAGAARHPKHGRIARQEGRAGLPTCRLLGPSRENMALHN